MTDRQIAIALTTALSVLLSLVQIGSDSKITNGKSYFTLQLAFYVIIMTFGNILSTLLAEGVVANIKPTEGSDGVTLAGPSWVWHSAIGVFGFEAIIQKLNITLFDKGVFSLNDWISKAKSSAVAATLEKAADLAIFFEQDLATQLYATVNGEELHTFVASILGSDLYQKALNSIQTSPQINKELYLATIASAQSPKKVKGILKSHQKKA